MPTRQQKIDAIYEKIANKELSFGCKVVITNTTFEYPVGEDGDEEIPCDIYFRYGRYNNLLIENIIFPDTPYQKINGIMYSDIFNFKHLTEEEISYGEDIYYFEGDGKNEKIIGHPVMIGDVLHWVDNNCNWEKKEEGIDSRNLEKHRNLVMSIYNYFISSYRMPIDDQSDECIDFIFDLLSNDENKTQNLEMA